MATSTAIETRSSQSIKIGIDLSICKSIKIGKSDLIDIDCIDQSVEIDDTLFRLSIYGEGMTTMHCFLVSV